MSRIRDFIYPISSQLSALNYSDPRHTDLVTSPDLSACGSFVGWLDILSEGPGHESWVYAPIIRTRCKGL